MENDVKNVSGAQFPQPAEDFQVRSATSLYQFLTKGVPPPCPCYVGVDDVLQVSLVWLIATTNALVNVRILRADGEIIPLSFVVQGIGAGGRAIQRFQLVEGFLLSCAATQTALGGITSQAYCTVALVRAPFDIVAQYEVLVTGNLSRIVPISYPQSPNQRETDGPGQPRSILIATPAAGADFTQTVPSSTRWRIVSLSATLTTAVAVANRNVDLVIDDGANVFAEISSGFSQVASLVNDYTWMDGGVAQAAFDNIVALPLPSQMFLPPTFRIRSETTGIQPADQWSAITMLVQQWIDGP
jgi:hypothetical protein